jgi:hypothetical protein
LLSSPEYEGEDYWDEEESINLNNDILQEYKNGNNYHANSDNNNADNMVIDSFNYTDNGSENNSIIIELPTVLAEKKKLVMVTDFRIGDDDEDDNNKNNDNNSNNDNNDMKNKNNNNQSPYVSIYNKVPDTYQDEVDFNLSTMSDSDCDLTLTNTSTMQVQNTYIDEFNLSCSDNSLTGEIPVKLSSFEINVEDDWQDGVEEETSIGGLRDSESSGDGGRCSTSTDQVNSNSSCNEDDNNNNNNNSKSNNCYNNINNSSNNNNNNSINIIEFTEYANSQTPLLSLNQCNNEEDKDNEENEQQLSPVLTHTMTRSSKTTQQPGVLTTMNSNVSHYHITDKDLLKENIENINDINVIGTAVINQFNEELTQISENNDTQDKENIAISSQVTSNNETNIETFNEKDKDLGRFLRSNIRFGDDNKYDSSSSSSSSSGSSSHNNDLVRYDSDLLQYSNIIYSNSIDQNSLFKEIDNKINKYMSKDKDQLPLIFVKSSNLHPQGEDWKSKCELEGLIECKEENEYKYTDSRKLLVMTEQDDDNDNGNKRVHRTIKYMHAIANGNWILNSTFLRDIWKNKIRNIDVIMDMMSGYEISCAFLDELERGPCRSRFARENGKLELLKGYHITLVKYDTNSKYSSGFENYFSQFDNMCYEFQSHSLLSIPGLIERLGGDCSVYDNTHHHLNLFSSSNSNSSNNRNKNISCILSNKTLKDLNETQTKKRKNENFDENKINVQYHWILDTICNFSIMDLSNYLIF